MSGIEQAMQLATSPPRLELELDVERRSDGKNRTDRQPITVAAFRPADRSRGETGSSGDIGLA
jgi:hypothetical protein